MTVAKLNTIIECEQDRKFLHFISTSLLVEPHWQSNSYKTKKLLLPWETVQDVHLAIAATQRVQGDICGYSTPGYNASQALNESERLLVLRPSASESFDAAYEALWRHHGMRDESEGW